MIRHVLFFILFNYSTTIFIFAGRPPKKLCSTNSYFYPINVIIYNTVQRYYHAFKNAFFRITKIHRQEPFREVLKVTYTKTKKTSIMYDTHDDKSPLRICFYEDLIFLTL